MFKGNMHPARRAFRKVLLGLLGVSFVMLVFVVGLRIHYRDGHIDGPMQTALFEYDVLQHKARAWVGDDKEDMVIINSLLQLSIFSHIYADAGLEMLDDKAKEGYPPAIERQAEIYAYLNPESVQAP